MPRQLRIEYPGAIYHMMNRGDRRETIFQAETQPTRPELVSKVRSDPFAATPEGARHFQIPGSHVVSHGT